LPAVGESDDETVGPGSEGGRDGVSFGVSEGVGWRP